LRNRSLFSSEERLELLRRRRDVQDEHVALLPQLLLVKTVGDSDDDDRVVEDLGRFEAGEWVAPTNSRLSNLYETIHSCNGASFIRMMKAGRQNLKPRPD
jgi:hypothetical protein